MVLDGGNDDYAEGLAEDMEEEEATDDPVMDVAPTPHQPDEALQDLSASPAPLTDAGKQMVTALEASPVVPGQAALENVCSTPKPVASNLALVDDGEDAQVPEPEPTTPLKVEQRSEQLRRALPCTPKQLFVEESPGEFDGTSNRQEAIKQLRPGLVSCQGLRTG